MGKKEITRIRRGLSTWLGSCLWLAAGLLLGVLAVVGTVRVLAQGAGAIWTTRNECGDAEQNVNHFDNGDTVFINASGFATGGSSYEWSITGKPGGASCDPNDAVASGVITLTDICTITRDHTVGVPPNCFCQCDGHGGFCFPAYVIQEDDCGEYQVRVGSKGDNYRVGPAQLELNKVVEDVNGSFLKVGDVLSYSVHYAAASRQTGVFIQDDYDQTRLTVGQVSTDTHFTTYNDDGDVLRWPGSGGVTLNRNASGRLWYTVTVTQAGVISNRACISSSTELPVCDTTVVTATEDGAPPQAQLSLVKTSEPVTAVTGYDGIITYTIDVTILNADLVSVTVTDTLPYSFTYAGQSANTCDLMGPTRVAGPPQSLVWTADEVPSATCTITFTAQISQDAPADLYCNDLLWTSDEVEERLANVACVTVGEPKGLLRACKYDDQNGNGKWDPGEPGLEGWEFVVDCPQLDPARRITLTTGITGCSPYTDICAAPIGCQSVYTMVEVLQDGWENTDPGGGSPPLQNVQCVKAGLQVTGTFGNWLRKIAVGGVSLPSRAGMMSVPAVGLAALMLVASVAVGRALWRRRT